MIYISIGKLIVPILILAWVIFAMSQGIMRVFRENTKICIIRSLAVCLFLAGYTMCVAVSLAIGEVVGSVVKDFVLSTVVCSVLYAIGVVLDPKLSKLLGNTGDSSKKEAQ